MSDFRIDTRIISILLILLVSFSSCKKTKLKDDDKTLIGNWHWKGGWSDNGDETIRLDIKQKGKYKLYRDGKLIEYGRILKEKDGYLTFKSDALTGIYLGDNDYVLNTCKITSINGNELGIAHCPWCSDDKTSDFIKN